MTKTAILHRGIDAALLKAVPPPSGNRQLPEGLEIVSVWAGGPQTTSFLVTFNQKVRGSTASGPGSTEWHYLADGTPHGLADILPHIAVKLDWTKPVRVVGDHRPVHVLTTNWIENPGDEPLVKLKVLPTPTQSSAGNILTRKLNGSLANDDNHGSLLNFENVPECEIVRIGVARDPALFTGVDVSRPRERPSADTTNIDLTFQNGKVVNVEIVK